MQRRDFIKLCGVLGIALPVGGCGWWSEDDQPTLEGELDGSVIIIGAGAAGMSAGHLLAQQGVDFRILEAAPTYGGRIKMAKSFVDFPIPLGGEWLHVDADALTRIVNDDSVDVTTETAPYRATDTAGWYEDGELSIGQLGEYGDLKFVGDTWLTFFEEYVLASVENHMQFDTQILEVDLTGDEVVLTSADGDRCRADVVVVTVPPKIIQDGALEFVPPLPNDQREAFDEADIWGGMKVFIEFGERFYPTILEIAGTNDDDGQKLFYDAAYGQDTETNVLGLFTVGEQSVPYQQRSGDALRDHLLAELDEIFDGAASRSYLQHIAQNWDEEPFVHQAYFADSADWRLPARMRATLDGRVFFAGASYTNGEDWGSVHTAAQSAREAVRRLLQ